MNPLSNVRLINELNKKEVRLGINEKASWHNEYKDSAWIFVGGLSYEFTEGDVVCVFSQYGEVVNINLIRDKATGKSKGYCFLCYEDQRSTVLAVDNLNGIKLSNRVIRVDHVANYKVPKDFADTDPLVKALRDEGCGPSVVKKAIDEIEIVEDEREPVLKVEKNTQRTASSRGDERKHSRDNIRIKKEKNDVVYDKHGDESNFSRRSERENNSKSVETRRNRSKTRTRPRNVSRSPPRNRARSASRSPPRTRPRSASISPPRTRPRSASRSPPRTRPRSASRSPPRNSARGASRSPTRNRTHKHQDYSSKNRQKRRRNRSRSKSPRLDRHSRKERSASASPKSRHHKRNQHSETSRHSKRT
uniref:RNA-binding motif protein, X-linked 2 n=1 Tax=Strigamia maritima TaxID=126957 RepID=T1INA9_STRMM